MFTIDQEVRGKKGKVRIFVKGDNGVKVEKGELDVQFRPIDTGSVERMAEENLLPSEIYDEVVEKIGPVGTGKKDDDGKEIVLPDDEALRAIRNNYEAMQQVIQYFWELHNVDPKQKTSRRRR